MYNGNTNSSYMHNEKANSAISLPMDNEDTRPATSFPVVKEEIKLLPCVLYLQLPGTNIKFSR
jgi:hypothetical protein